jgi:alkylation response protein AidB-like acyl-CoA dehydrogenase
MELRTSAAETEFREQVRSFTDRHLPHELRDRVLNFKRIHRDDYMLWQNILFQHGWAAPSWPIEYGGTGWSVAQRTIFEEETLAAGAPRQMPFGLTLVAPVIQEFGRADQKAHFLPKILTMEHWWCQGYSEPGAGSDLAALKTRAERVGERYIVNGQKTWTSFAHWANWIFCLVRTGAGERPQQGISFLLIDMSTPGIQVRPIKTLDGGADVNDVFFDGVEVPVKNRIGVENEGWAIAKFLLGHERMAVAALGNCKRMLRRLKEIAAVIPKRNKPLIADVRFRDRIARVEIEFIAHEWAVRRAISLEAAGRSVGVHPSILKIRASEIQQTLSELVMECAGPYALPYVPQALEAELHPDTAGPEFLNGLAAQYFDWRKVSIYGGTTEVQKNIISKSIFKS